MKISLRLLIVFLFLGNTVLLAQNDLDTTFISRDTSGGIYHAVYVETDKKSKYYDWLTNFQFDNYDSLAYQESINAIFKESPAKFSKPKINSTLPRQWCGLNSFKDQFYLYAPSDWGNISNLIISDSTIIEYFMDGPYAYIIDSVQTIDSNTFEFSVHSAYRTTTKMTIYLIDWENQIAIFDNHAEGDLYRYSLMLGSSKARQFPIIVNYCKAQKQIEFNFDYPIYKRLLPRKNEKINQTNSDRLLNYGQEMKFELNEAIQKIDSLKFVEEMPYMCESGICGDELYWQTVRVGKNNIELLIDRLDDTTSTSANVVLFGGKYTIADIVFDALTEIIQDIPTFELLGVPFDKDGCGYCAYYQHLNKNFSNRQKFKEAVTNWYHKNKENLVWIESDKFATCDCSGKHPNGGHYKLKTENK